MASIPDPSLEMGEAALNQGDYTTAIAHLEGVCEIELDEKVISRAQQALVVAYTKSNKIREAIALCQSLKDSPLDKAWAAKTFTDLVKRYPEALAPETEDSTPLETTNKTSPASRDKTNLPVPFVKPATGAEVFTPGRQWRNAPKAKRWQPMKKLQLRRLWLVELITIVALFWVFRFTIARAMAIINDLMVKLPYFQPFQLLYNDPTIALIIFLIILLITSPWLLDIFLKQFYGLKTLPLNELASQKPESARLLQKYCRRRKITLPKLGILPTYTPVAMNYGYLARNARIVISEGLLQKLEDQELATIYGSQLGQIINGDFSFMSTIMVLLQIPFTLYWQSASLGEYLAKQIKSSLANSFKFIHYNIWFYFSEIVKGIMAIVAALFYGIYWLWRVPVLWFSRWRCYYSDRLAAEITGNPNAFCRALLKIAIGITEQVQFQNHTNWLLEGFDLMMPIGHRQAIALGGLSDYTPYEKVLAWECSNPYRHWLAQVNSHPLIGDRLYLLGRYAYFWKLEPEIDLPTLRPPPKDNRTRFIKIKNCYQALPILQSAFLAGLVFGIVFRNILRLIGFICDWLNIWQLIWLHNANPFLNACILFAFSISIIIWINGYFPDIKIAPTRNEPRLQDLLADTDTVPPKSDGVRLAGKLLGRKGISNWLGQDLILQTSTGLVKLHFYSMLGPLGNLFPLFKQPHEFVNQEVIVSGWFRRGSTPWIDVDIIKSKGGKSLRSGYPIWLTILAVSSSVIGAYLIWKV